ALGAEYLGNNKQRKTIHMAGRQVFRFATNVISDVIEDVLEKADLDLDDVALIVPHQANKRIIEAAAKKLKVDPSLFYLNLNRFGNTSAASIPIALCDVVEEGLLKPDDNVVFVGFGGGLTWAATVIKWDVTPPQVSLVDREWKRARYMVARGRSRFRKLSRRLGARILGSPTPDATLRDLGEHENPTGESPIED
ncbi:MAG: 3-oxoacyl-[acyl-carrier-protein] synthase III C-terminal domain-containing protein, partial [Candidatus Promineifilaceae bacterium]